MTVYQEEKDQRYEGLINKTMKNTYKVVIILSIDSSMIFANDFIKVECRRKYIGKNAILQL